jgi:hypothetical protein
MDNKSQEILSNPAAICHILPSSQFPPAVGDEIWRAVNNFST